MAKKGGARQVGGPDADFQDTALSRKQVSSVFDSLGGVIKKSLAWQRPVHDARPDEVEGSEEARNEGA